ncbi:MAG: hypothetical protein RLZZ290_1125, partial [Pseudomonadota bacterium]
IDHPVSKAAASRSGDSLVGSQLLALWPQAHLLGPI